MFLQGACGNIRPRTFDPGNYGFRQGTAEELERMGHACAHEVVTLLHDGLRPAGGELSAAKQQLGLPLEHQPTLEMLKKQVDSTDQFERLFAQWAVQQWPDGRIPREMRYEVQLLTFGDDVSVLAMPGEVVNELGYAARRIVPRPTAFCGYSNGLPAYIPTARIRRQGGYESGLRANEFFGVPGWLMPESELVILGAVEALCGEHPAELIG